MTAEAGVARRAPAKGGPDARHASAGRLPGWLTHWVTRRVAQSLLVVLLAFTVAFVLLQAMPGDSLAIRFENPELGLSPEQIEQLRQAYGADRPVLLQYLSTLGAFLTGDFGYSVQTGTPVRQLIADAAPRTAVLALASFVTAGVLAFGVALLASTRRWRRLGDLVRAIPSVFVAVPVFWLGIMLVQVVSFRLGWVSVINPGPVEGIILPVLTIAVPISAPIAQILLRSIDQVATSPFVAVVRAKGASWSWVLWHNVLKNALLPTITVAGLLFGELVGGAVVTETVFGRAGLGRIAEQAVAHQDTVVLQAVVLLSAVVFVLVNLVVDLVHPVLDARLRARH